MRKLNNTDEDRHFLNTVLSAGSFPKAKFELGVFTSDLAISLTTVDYYGRVTSVDMIDGYCHWERKGVKMPCVNINVITLL